MPYFFVWIVFSYVGLYGLWFGFHMVLLGIFYQCAK